MALDKSKVDDLLVDFVVRNQSDLQSNQKENPALYDAVLSALSVLARKFGSGQVLADPVPAAFYTTPEPEPAVPSNALNFEIGDVFDRKGAIGIKFFIKQINIESDKVLIANLENENDVSDYSIGEVENKFKKRIWVKTGDKFMPLPNKPASKPMYFKVGDVFYTKGYKDIKYYIFSIDKQANDVLVGSVSGAFSGTTRYDGDEANRYLYDGTWVFTGEIHMPPSTPALPFKEGDIIENDILAKKLLIKKIDSNYNVVEIAELEYPDVTINNLEFFQAKEFFEKGEWKVVGNINDTVPTMLPIKVNDIIADFKLKQDFLVRYIDPYTDAVHLAEFDEPNLTAHKYSFSDAMAYLNNGRFVIKPKTYSKSAPPPDPFASLINKPKSSVTTAIKKTAAKTKKVVSPEEKELLDAIKTLKPLVGLDPDIQKEIDELNVKLTELRNKKD